MTSVTPLPADFTVPLMEPSPFPPFRSTAQPVAHERWERVITTVTVPADLESVWTALTDPDRVGQWLARTGTTWARENERSMLDFRDGEFFWCHTDAVEPPGTDGHSARLSYRWRWVGVGPATRVTWQLTAMGAATTVTTTEISSNGPSDWRSWNGTGWPGILDQFSDHVQTGRDMRWTWRRMGPYVQAELPLPAYEAWAALTAVPALQYWTGRTAGSLNVDDPMSFVIGDASGSCVLTVTEHLEAGQRFPSYLPSLNFRLDRGGWPGHLSGHLWIEPTHLGGSLLQVFHQGWEMFGSTETAPHDRILLTQFWAGAFDRLGSLVRRMSPPPDMPGGIPG